MGVLKSNNNRFSSNGDHKSNVKSKGQRLGWVSLKDAKTITLDPSSVQAGEVVRRRTKSSPLLVP